MNNLTLGVLITLAQWMTPAPVYSRGGAVFYAPGVMVANCQYRADLAGLSYDDWMDGAVDGVALMSPADLGKTVWLKRPGGEWEGPFRSCDCGMRSHVWEMVTIRGEVVEVGWGTAESWGMGPFDGGWKLKGVEVYVGEARPDWHSPEPVDYVEWFKQMAEGG